MVFFNFLHLITGVSFLKMGDFDHKYFLSNIIPKSALTMSSSFWPGDNVDNKEMTKTQNDLGNLIYFRRIRVVRSNVLRRSNLYTG